MKSQFLSEVVISEKPYLSKNEEWRDSLARVMLTGILKNQFYRDVDAQVKEAIPLISYAAKQDPLYLLKAATFARDANMKGMVKVGLVALSSIADDRFLNNPVHKSAIISLLGTFHPGQLLQFVELSKGKVFGRGFGSRPQKWVRAVMESWSAEKIEDFTLKYPSALNSLVRLVHPRYDENRGALIKYVLDDKKQPHGEKQKAVDALKAKDVPANTIAKTMLEKSIPWDVVKGFAGMNDPHLCMAMMTQMGLSALLLNIRSLEEHNVFDSNGLNALRLKLDEVKLGRSIPIDFAKPYIYSQNDRVKSLLESAIVSCLDIPIQYIENKKIGVSIDISSSMSGPPLITAGLVAIPFLKSNSLWFTTFDTELYEEGTSHRSSYGTRCVCPRVTGLSKKEQVKAMLNLEVCGGTNIAASLERAIANKIKLDLHVIITDEQQNAGTPLMLAWKKYKATVNKKAELWVINASPTEWHSADFNDPSVIVYQTMTPAIFKNLKYFGVDMVTEINSYEIKP